MRVSLVVATASLAGALPQDHRRSDGGTVGATPHDSYSSSVGVLGCKIDTNRVAYWPSAVDCDEICISLSYADRSVYLLKIDQSAGAHDISYDAWNYLYTGHSATDKPTAGGAVSMTYRNVDASKCSSLINTKGGKLPLSAANSMNFLASCLAKNTSWVANHYELLNIADPICTLGIDETCSIDWPAFNQPTCPHTLGSNPPLKDDPVYNIRYPTGQKVLAGAAPGTGPAEDASSCLVPGSWFVIAAAVLYIL